MIFCEPASSPDCSLRHAFRDLPRDAWIVQAGTAVSSRTRDGVPNSVNLLRCEASPAARRCRIERWDYADDERAFGRVEYHEVEFG